MDRQTYIELQERKRELWDELEGLEKELADATRGETVSGHVWTAGEEIIDLETGVSLSLDDIGSILNALSLHNHTGVQAVVAPFDEAPLLPPTQEEPTRPAQTKEQIGISEFLNQVFTLRNPKKTQFIEMLQDPKSSKAPRQLPQGKLLLTNEATRTDLENFLMDGLERATMPFVQVVMVEMRDERYERGSRSRKKSRIASRILRSPQ